MVRGAEYSNICTRRAELIILAISQGKRRYAALEDPNNDKYQKLYQKLYSTIRNLHLLHLISVYVTKIIISEFKFAHRAFD